MTPRTCPLCECVVRGSYCCGIDFTAPRAAWRMTPDRVKHVHAVARSRKGLTEEAYRLRLKAVGVTSSVLLDREQFTEFLAGVAKLPDCPLWKAKQRNRIHARESAMGAGHARANAAGARPGHHDDDRRRAVPMGTIGAGGADGSAGLVGMPTASGAGSK